MVRLVCKSILQQAQEFDDNAQIASVSRRDFDDSVLVRLRLQSGSVAIVNALRSSWPLASVSMVKNLVDGRTEAQVLLPNAHQQHELAKILAKTSAWQKPLKIAANTLVATIAIACMLRVLEISKY